MVRRVAKKGLVRRGLHSSLYSFGKCYESKNKDIVCKRAMQTIFVLFCKNYKSVNNVLTLHRPLIFLSILLLYINKNTKILTFLVTLGYRMWFAILHIYNEAEEVIKVERKENKPNRYENKRERNQMKKRRKRWIYFILEFKISTKCALVSFRNLYVNAKDTTMLFFIQMQMSMH